MIVKENGIRYRFKKKALLLAALGTVSGTILISRFLGVTVNDIKNLNPSQLIKIIPATLLSLIVTNHLIAKTIRFANPVGGQRVSLKNGTWIKRRSRRSRKSRRSRRSRKSRRSRRSRKSRKSRRSRR